MRRTTTKKSAHPVVAKVNDVQKRVTKLGSDVDALLSKIKKDYHRLDRTTQKQIAAGIAGLGVVLAATAFYKKKRARRK